MHTVQQLLGLMTKLGIADATIARYLAIVATENVHQMSSFGVSEALWKFQKLGVSQVDISPFVQRLVDQLDEGDRAEIGRSVSMSVYALHKLGWS